MVTRRRVVAFTAALVAPLASHIVPPAVEARKKRKNVTRTFSNTAAITTTGGGEATPYPSSIQVSGFKKGKVRKVRVFLNQYTAAVPDDIDVMLSATQIPGQTAVVMSDAGGAVAVSNVNLVLDDDAATPLPDDGVPPLTTGTYKPTNYAGGSADMFPAPAPTTNGNSALSVFNGANPNGEWQLWINDYPGNGPVQFAGGWSIEITARVKKKKKKKKK